MKVLILALPLAGALSAVPLKTARTWGPKTFVPVWLHIAALGALCVPLKLALRL